MRENNAAIATAYYTAIGNKDIESVEKCIHPDIQFIAPLATVTGKAAFLEAAKRVTSFFKTLKIRATFGSDTQAMVVYDLECPEPVGKFSTAVLMSLQSGLITKIELFFDARPFEKM